MYIYLINDVFGIQQITQQHQEQAQKSHQFPPKPIQVPQFLIQTQEVVTPRLEVQDADKKLQQVIDKINEIGSLIPSRIDSEKTMKEIESKTNQHFGEVIENYKYDIQQYIKQQMRIEMESIKQGLTEELQSVVQTIDDKFGQIANQAEERFQKLVLQDQINEEELQQLEAELGRYSELHAHNAQQNTVGQSQQADVLLQSNLRKQEYEDFENEIIIAQIPRTSQPIRQNKSDCQDVQVIQTSRVQSSQKPMDAAKVSPVISKAEPEPNVVLQEIEEDRPSPQNVLLSVATKEHFKQKEEVIGDILHAHSVDVPQDDHPIIAQKYNIDVGREQPKNYLSTTQQLSNDDQYISIFDQEIEQTEQQLKQIDAELKFNSVCELNNKLNADSIVERHLAATCKNQVANNKSIQQILTDIKQEEVKYEKMCSSVNDSKIIKDQTQQHIRSLSMNLQNIANILANDQDKTARRLDVLQVYNGHNLPKLVRRMENQIQQLEWQMTTMTDTLKLQQVDEQK